MLGALTLRLNAAQILSFAVGPQASPGSPGKTQKSGAQNTATAAESSLAVQMAADVLDSEWEDEEDDIMGQYSDAEWARRAKVGRLYQVPLDRFSTCCHRQTSESDVMTLRSLSQHLRNCVSASPRLVCHASPVLLQHCVMMNSKACCDELA